jgi:hypothetical protein
MKKMIALSMALMAISSISFADEICGTLGSHVVGLQCETGQMCLMMLRLQYDLTTANGSHFDLMTSSAATFENFGAMKGSDVCVQGSTSENGFEVTSVSAN